MKKNLVYGLLVNGLERCLNVTDELCISWSLAPCKEQKEFTVTVFCGKEVVLSESQKSNKQAFITQNLNLLPLTEYAFEVSVATDCFVAKERGSFLTGLTNGFGNARWISNGNHFVEETEKVGSPAIYLKKEFDVDSVPSRAIINVCGLGLYELYVNDERIGDSVLEPAFTDYTKRVLYSTYDVKEKLHEGKNVISVVLGDGWYNQTTKDTWGFYRAPWRDCPKMILRLDCDDFSVVSDSSWLVSYDGVIVSNALRVGEFHDSNEKWDFHPVSLTTPPGGELTPSYLPPIRECEHLKPVKIINGDGCKIYDFGKNISGYCSVIFVGEGDGLAYMEYSDRISEGKVDNASNSMYIFNSTSYQKDGCKLGYGITKFKPKFVYHGFRYVAIYTDAVILQVEAHFVRTDLKRKGRFSCSSEKLNRLYDMSMNAILSNYHGMPTDCPHREKNGWTGDAQLSLEPSVYNFDMKYAYKKWLDDFKDNQRPSGQISAIIPTCGWGFNWGSGPAWDIAFFRVLEGIRYYYDDLPAVEEFYPYLKKYYSYISGYENGGLLCVGLGDWNYPRRIEFDVCPTELTASCYFYLMAKILCDYASVLEPEASEGYKADAERIASAILVKYSEEKSLTGMAALSYFGLADRVNEVCEYIEKNNYEPHFGILGNKFVFDVLGRCGRSDIGLKMLEKEDYPSFYYWAANGQTSLCEDFELTNSLNHHMYSPIAEYMMRYICGVEIGEGFRTFTVKPALPVEMDWAEVSIDTANGTFKARVERVQEGVAVKLSVPANVKAVYCGREYSAGEYTL